MRGQRQPLASYDQPLDQPLFLASSLFPFSRGDGRMEPIAEITEPETVGKILRAMGLPDSPPRAAPARSPPQMDIDFVQ